MKIRDYHFFLVVSSCCAVSAFLGSSGALANVDSSVELDKIHHINEAEIQLSKMALEKAQSPDVKKFAQVMIDQHTDADGQVKKLAADEGIGLPQFQASDVEQLDTQRLEGLEGARFDREFMGRMKKGHLAALSELDGIKGSTQDDKLKALVKKLEPTVKEHERMASSVKKGLMEKAPL